MRKDGIFVSRVNLGSLVEVNGLLHVGDEIIKVNSVDVTILSLDDVVVIMQYVKKMVLTIKILTSVTLTRAFSTRLQKRTPKEVASVRRTSSYAEKIAIRQHSDSLSDNDEIKFGNPYEEIKLGPQNERTVNTTIIEKPIAAEPQTQQQFKAASFYGDDIKLGNPYEDVEFDDKSEEVLDIQLDKSVPSSPTYEEIAVVASSDSPALSTKHDTTGWRNDMKQQGSDSPIASSTPVLHRKLDTSIMHQQEETPQPMDSGLVQDKSLDMEDPNERRTSFDAPPNFKPPPPPSEDNGEEQGNADEASHSLNLTNVTNEETTTSLNFSSDLKLDDTDTDSESGSLAPPIPPFRLNIEDFDEPPDFQPPPLPSRPPPEQDDNNTPMGAVSPHYTNNTSQLSTDENPGEDSVERVFSGMLAATIYGMDEGTTVVQSGNKYSFSCTIGIDSVVRVRHVFKFSTSSLERSLGEELDPFQIDLRNNREATVRFYKNDEQILEKTVQFSDLFGSDPSKESPVHELHLMPSPLGELTLSLEYQPMSVFIKRMSSEANHYSCATFQDYVFSSPNSSEYPVVVEQCVRIIEEHGLREPGLYQCCVSESSKNEALQVGLSQTKKPAEIQASVSQLSIHAFTGVLKDFFRNLPEPLLTNDISLSATEAASMENAAMVGADVMQGFINCLPEEVLSTLQLLILHFQRVCQHDRENGLSVQKLSQIFGPLLLAPACNVDRNTSVSSAEYAEDYDSQAKAIAILMSLQKIENPPYIIHKV